MKRLLAINLARLLQPYIRLVKIGIPSCDYGRDKSVRAFLRARITVSAARSDKRISQYVQF
ncbi:hypothetical protein GCM10027180_02140 [Microbulbifer echini]